MSKGKHQIPEELAKALELDTETGKLYWLENPPYRKNLAGTEAGSKNPNGYIYIKYKGTKYLAHRIVWRKAFDNDPAENTIDHINGIKDDNRPSNLRIIEQWVEQNINSGALGYYWDRREQLLVSTLQIDGTHIRLGGFICPLVARVAYHSKVNELFPKLRISFVPRVEIKGNPLAKKQRSLKSLGYSFDKLRNKLISRCVVEGRYYFLGQYDCPLLARIAYHEKINEDNEGNALSFVPSCRIKPGPYAVLSG